jgi:adenylosuccinate synthase
MVNTVVVGTQWGDEGKAKVIDFLAEKHDAVIRVQGGANAGHTYENDRMRFISHLVPAGALHEGKTCIIGNGVVLEPPQLLEEIAELESKGVNIRERLWISGNTQLILPWHKILDGAKDDAKGSNKIGTTKRGIGPAYEDKAARTGIRMEETFDWHRLNKRLIDTYQKEKSYLFQRYGKELMTSGSIAKLTDELNQFGMQFKDKTVNLAYFLRDLIKQKKSLLFEGAQGTFLDIDHGTYPFVTSSNCIAGGACTGAGVGPTYIDEAVGIVKAYTTRVGEGGFPAELGKYSEAKGEEKATPEELSSLLTKINKGEASEYEIGRYLRGIGAEYGATTGRPRRTGWLDGVMVEKAAFVNGLSGIAITKLDVLSGLDEIKICAGYEIDGQKTNQFPTDIEILGKARPVYESHEGWKENISGITEFDKLPANAKKYVTRMEELANAEARIISVGPKRNQTIIR